MPTAIPTASLSLGRLLATPYRFVVPPYQRGYAWTTKEAVQLLEDILAASGADGAELAEPDYFLGSMLLLDAAGAGDFPAEPAGFAAAMVQLIALSVSALALLGGTISVNQAHSLAALDGLSRRRHRRKRGGAGGFAAVWQHGSCHHQFQR